MTHERLGKFKEKITTISVAVSLFLTIGGVAIGLINYYTLNQLQPISARIAQIEATQLIAKDELIIYKHTQDILIEKLATKEQINNLLTRVDKISSRIDLIISKLIK